MTRRILGCAALAACVLTAIPAAAQQRPLVTEDPEVIGAGLILLEGGFDYSRDILFPASGLQGNLLRVPTLGVSFGISSIAELQLDGGFYNRLNAKHTGVGPAPLASYLTFTGDSTHDVEDIVLATKIRIAGETPGIRLWFTFCHEAAHRRQRERPGPRHDRLSCATAGREDGAVDPDRRNIGLGILGDPTRGDNQNDVLDYGVSVARAVREGLEVVGELNGRANTRSGTPPVGTDSRAAFRVGGRFTRGTVRIDTAILIGVTSRDPAFGFTAGATYVFKGFTVK